MKIYTRTGDEGMTGLFGGERVHKSHPRIEAYGTVDETNSWLGFVLSHFEPDHPGAGVAVPMLIRIQEELFIAGADLATPLAARSWVPRIGQEHVDRLEADIDRLEADLAPLQTFILPGGTRAGAALHVARTTCRRAERLAVEAARSDVFSAPALTYLNRLSDFLFVLARWVNHVAGAPEQAWLPRSSAAP